MTTEPPVAPQLRRRRASARIGEIDGLRGIALTLVVLFHLFGDGRVSGGVDVFLTVSGFLLVLSLGRALQRDRPLGIVSRWGRTFARLAPPAAIVLIVVTILSFTIFSPWTRGQNLVEVVSAALYVENWQLIVSQLAYGAAGPETSPLQHFWSLSVQAQFFLLFPLAVALVARVLPGLGVRQYVFWGLLFSATVGSFAFAWHTNLVDPQVAYFHTGARFWELGVGGLVAGLVLARVRIPTAARAVTGWLGLVMIVSSGFLVDGGASYPGPAALLPVGGAALVIVSSGGGRGSPSSLLTSRPLVFLDRISYGLYLWHWPILIGFLAVNGGDGVDPLGASAVLAAALLATLATRALLARLMAWTTAADARRSLSFALVAIVVAAAPAGIVQAARTSEAPAVALDACSGAAALDPERPECATSAEEGDPIPALDMLADDRADLPGCFAYPHEHDVKMCTLGMESGYAKRLLVVGDSHNNAWVEVYAKIAEKNGWRMDVSSRAGCQWISPDAPRRGRDVGAQDACIEWRHAMNGYAGSGDYDAIVTMASTKAGFKPVPEGMTYEQFHAHLITEAWRHRPSASVPIIAIRDNPVFPRSALDCLADREAAAAGECSLPREEAIRRTGLYEAIERTENAHLVDLMDRQCGPERCDLIVGGVIITRDGDHLTRTFAATLEPYLDEELRELIG